MSHQVTLKLGEYNVVVLRGKEGYSNYTYPGLSKARMEARLWKNSNADVEVHLYGKTGKELKI